MEKVYKRLADIRGDMDLTQKKMAEQLNVAEGTYSKWEREIEIMPLERANQICNLTGYSMDYLTGLSHDRTKTIKKHILSKKEVGQRLKEFRIEQGLTQQELAEFLNTGQSTISAYELGTTLILSAFIYQIAKKYQVSIDWICARNDQKYLTNRKK